MDIPKEQAKRIIRENFRRLVAESTSSRRLILEAAEGAIINEIDNYDDAAARCHFGDQRTGVPAVYEGWYRPSEGRMIRITVCEDHKRELIGHRGPNETTETDPTVCHGEKLLEMYGG